MKIGDIIRVTTWKNGSKQNPNSAYGVRVRKADFEKMKNWNEIQIPKFGSITRDNRAFTPKCPEIRHYLIGQFLKKNNLSDWPERKTYSINLKYLGNSKFELSK